MMVLKRTLAILIGICIFFISGLVAFAGNEDIDSKAEILVKLSILQGDGNDYNYNGQLTRAEASAFITRVLGKERYVKENIIKYTKAGYSDIEGTEWFVPYVSFCSEQGIISGYPDGKFNPSEYISEKGFLKMLMVAFNYRYGENFNWDNVFEKAVEYGFIADYVNSADGEGTLHYKRQDVIELIFNILQKEFYNSDNTILDNLLLNGAVERHVLVSLGYFKDDPETDIEKIIVESKNRIIIKLNEEIKDLSGTQIKVFESSNPSKVLTTDILKQEGKEITLQTEVQAEEKEYSVELKDVQDLEGNVIKRAVSNFKGYKLVEIETDFFRVRKIEVISKSLLNVYFTQPINMNSTLPMYFEILEEGKPFVKGEFSTIAASVKNSDSKAMVLYLKNKNFVEGNTYTLKIDGNLSSIYGAQLGEEKGDSMNFVGVSDADPAMHVVSVRPIDSNILEVVFSDELDITSAQDIQNYKIDSTWPVHNVVIGNHGNTKAKSVYLYTALPIDKAQRYELQIKNIKNSTGQYVINEAKYPFVGEEREVSDLKIVNVFSVDKQTLGVYLDRPLYSASNIGDALFYTIMGDNYIANPSNVFYDPSINPYYVKLFLSPSNALTTGKQYSLKISMLMKDFLGKESKKDSEATFIAGGLEDPKPFIYEAKIISTNLILLKANKELDINSVNTDPGNYYLEYKEGETTKRITPSSVSTTDPSTFVLKVDSLEINKEYTLKFNSLLDMGGNIRTASDVLSSVTVSRGK